MEQENIRLGKEQGFRGIFTTNSNKLTQLISRTLNYQVKVYLSSAAPTSAWASAGTSSEHTKWGLPEALAGSPTLTLGALAGLLGRLTSLSPEFLKINLAKDTSILLLMDSFSTSGFLTKTRLYSVFENTYKKSMKPENLSLFVNWILYKSKWG